MENGQSRPGSGCRFCVIIPAHNEEGGIGDTLRSVLDAGIPPGDIFVIDDCSSDRTSEVASREAIRLFRNPVNLGKAESIARVLSREPVFDRYDLIALLDADTEVDPGYFDAMTTAAARHEDVVLFVGQVKSRRHNWVTASRAFDYTFMHDVYKTAQSKLSVVTVSPGCSSVYRSRALREIEIRGDTLAEDMDWTIQVHRKNLGKALYLKEAVVYTQDPATLGDYVRQIRRWYAGFMQVIRKHRIPMGLQRIDLEVGFLLLEGLLYGTLLAMAPLLVPLLALNDSRWVLTLIAMDAAVFSGLALYGAARNRRPDILFYFPVFYLIRYLNACMYLESFHRVFVRKEESRIWHKAARYRFSGERGDSARESSLPS